MIAPAVTRQTQTEWFASWFDSLHYHRLYADRDDHESPSVNGARAAR